MACQKKDLPSQALQAKQVFSFMLEVDLFFLIFTDSGKDDQPRQKQELLTFTDLQEKEFERTATTTKLSDSRLCILKKNSNIR